MFTVSEVLAHHGYASIDDAREYNVTFGCLVCGSVAAVTASNEFERRVQRDAIAWECCADGDDFEL